MGERAGKGFCLRTENISEDRLNRKWMNIITGQLGNAFCTHEGLFKKSEKRIELNLIYKVPFKVVIKIVAIMVIAFYRPLEGNVALLRKYFIPCFPDIVIVYEWKMKV